MEYYFWFKNLIADVESFPKRYNEIFFHEVLFKLECFKVTVSPTLALRKICNTTRRLPRRLDMSFVLGERLENNAANEDKIGLWSGQSRRDRSVIRPVKARSVCNPASQGEIGLWSGQSRRNRSVIRSAKVRSVCGAASQGNYIKCSNCAPFTVWQWAIRSYGGFCVL